jgi:transcriptional regulator with XRE-family HTH domain
MSRQEEELRIAGLLEALFQAARIPTGELERRTGLAGGTLARIFRGEVELKFRHVFSVLDALAVAPGEFFRLAYKERPSGGDLLAQEILVLLGDNLPARQGRRPGGDPGSEPVSPISDEELDRRILKALREQESGGRQDEPRRG